MSSEVLEADKLAPIEQNTLPSKNQISEEHVPFYEYLLQAVDRVRSLSACSKVLWADFSVSVQRRGSPVIYVRYENTKSDTHNAYFDIHELESN